MKTVFLTFVGIGMISAAAAFANGPEIDKPFNDSCKSDCGEPEKPEKPEPPKKPEPPEKPEPPAPEPEKPEPRAEAEPERRENPGRECQHDQGARDRWYKCEAPKREKPRPVTDQTVAPKGESR